MAVFPGAHVGKYQIIALLGAGGMGEVYRAHDTTLRRDVAIKLLPDRFALDPERGLRFQREARTLASLNHPHIGAIYGVEEFDGTQGLILELIEGETLAERLRRGAIPQDESLRIARQIAEALQAAHERGIAHRDLKPANVKLTPEGVVKVLDFGLAKAIAGEAGTFDSKESPTTTATGTRHGVVLGTAAYMSPEQARGQTVDRRTDLWAFGTVLYELLTGTLAFPGDTVSDSVAQVLTKEPDWTALPATTPARVRTLLRRCLVKERSERLDSAVAVRLEIDDALAAPVLDDRAHARESVHRRWRGRTTAVIVFCGLVGAIVSAVLLASRPPAAPDLPAMRLQVQTPGGHATSFAISPDARKVVFAATIGGKTQLWLRELAGETAAPLAGTDGGTHPFWSPDSQSVGFFTTNQLKRISIDGGPAQVVAAAPIGHGGTWNSEGIIVFAPDPTGPLYRVAASGGVPVQTTRLETPGITGHWHPYFLPDGRHFLFVAWGAPAQKGVYVGSLESADTYRLFDVDSEAVFAPPDLVLFARRGVLMGQRLELSAWKPVGDPMVVAPAMIIDPWRGISGGVSASAAGPIAYRANRQGEQLIWFERSGREIERVADVDTARPRFFRVSPDGRQIAVARLGEQYQDVWLVDPEGARQRLTFDDGNKFEPIWSPDGRHIVFTWDPNGILDLYEKAVDGRNGNGSLLWSSPEHKRAQDWSMDGRFVLYANLSAATGRDLFALRVDGDKKPLEVARTPFSETSGRFSPDSRWVAYMSNETGRDEIYVQSFPGPGGRRPITSAGGTGPQWGAEGRELFYLAPDNRLMTVPITVTEGRIQLGRPVALFEVPVGSEYVASPDGQRFLINKVVAEASPVTILLNWSPE